jgi:hypothetical protein
MAKVAEFALSFHGCDAFTERLDVGEARSSRFLDLSGREDASAEETSKRVVHASAHVDGVVDAIHGARIEAKRRVVAFIVVAQNERAIQSNTEEVHMRAFMDKGLQNFELSLVALRIHQDGSPKTERGDAMEGELLVGVPLGENYLY